MSHTKASTGTDAAAAILEASRTRPWSSSPTNHGYPAAPSSSSAADTVPISSTRRLLICAEVLHRHGPSPAGSLALTTRAASKKQVAFAARRSFLG